MTDAVDEMVADALVSGRITDDDAEAVRLFRDFLALAGPPLRPGERRGPDEPSTLERLNDAGRHDLIAWVVSGGSDPRTRTANDQ